jgi:hypothetical protein
MQRFRFLAALALATAFVASPASAMPDVVSYAARVENDAGPFDGTAAVSFALFSSRTGGAALWTEEVASVVVVDGDLVHDLGSVEPLDAALLDEDALFLEVTFNGETLTPRVAINAAPYALRAREAELAEVAVDAEQLGGRPASAYTFAAATGGGLVLTDTSFAIAPAGVTSTHLANGAVGSAAIADGSVAAVDLANGAVVASKIAPGAVGVDALAAGAVTTAKLASAAVTSTAIADGAIVASKVAASAIGEASLASNSVTSAKIATAAVTSAKLSGGTTQLAVRPVGCGGGLQTLNQRLTSGSRPVGCTGGLARIDGGAVCSLGIPCVCPTCTTLMCGINSSGNPRFMACDGTCGLAVTATTCTADTYPDTNVGFAVFAP